MGLRRNSTIRKWEAIIFAFLLVACTDEVPVPVPPIPPVDNEQDVMIKIAFPSAVSPKTYSIDASKENEIASLDIFAFTSGGGDVSNDKFAYRVSITGTDISDSNSDGSTKTVIARLKRLFQRQRFIVLANLPATVNLSLEPEVTTQKEIIEQLRFGGSFWRNQSAEHTSFPMWGQTTDSILINGSVSGTPVVESMPNLGKVNLIRSMARIDIGVDVYGPNDPALGFGKYFKIDSVYVCNISDSGFVAPNKDYLNATVIEKTNTISDRIEHIGYKYPQGEQIMARTIYVPETDSLIIKNVTDSIKPAFLVVKAFYYDFSDPYYYRIDFTADNEYKPLIRNHVYTIDIKGVRTPGFLTLDSAKRAPLSTVNFSLTLEENDIDLDEIATHNEQYILAYKANTIYLDWDETSVSIPVRTTYQNGWRASSSDFSLLTSSGEKDVRGVVDFNLQENKSGKPFLGTITLKAGMITREIKVIQGGGSNSYITKPGTAIRIPITSADIDGINRSAGCSNIVEVWKDGITNMHISFVNDNVFSVTPTGTGNAVVAMTNSNGDILWSWHIWATAYEPEQDINYRHNNGFIFMDRNLGASDNQTNQNSYGLYYQWGRKDPFIGEIATTAPWTIEGIPATDNLEESIKHPTIFYTTETYPFDWLGTNQDNSLWDTERKSIYDPCPFGWRVPIVKDDYTGSPWYGFGKNTHNGAVYPLSGGLDMGSGKQVNNSSKGYVWGASARNSNAFVLDITLTEAESSSAFRANAYPVRCVRDTYK